MSTAYRSKIGLMFILAILFILMLAAILFYKKMLGGGIFFCCLTIFLLYLYSATKYIINDQSLVIKCSFLINIHIPIDSITYIERTTTALSAPAFSILGRILITYNNNTSTIIISPVKTYNFCERLKSINPHIKVKI